jgi:hypothetical protein
MAPPHVSEFMVNLAKHLQEAKDVSESTAISYLNILRKLNDDKNFDNLAFLKKRDTIMAKIDKYAESTQKSTLGTIVSVLTSQKDKSSYKPTYNFYYDRMMDATKKHRENNNNNEKTEKQENNWLKWEDVLKKHTELGDIVKEFSKSKVFSAPMWNTLLAYTILSLYCLIPPRRNQDFQDLYVVRVAPDDKTKNYYETSTKHLIFNKYKTAKSHGVQTIDISQNKPLVEVITFYLKNHPHRKEKEYRFLVNSDGSSLSSVNSITRILNKVFGKQVGSSMLRHIFLSDKYGSLLEAQKEDSELMGHTLNQQREYIKKDGES